jgi:ABC-type antimicrobial peptide transport system permease subunit
MTQPAYAPPSFHKRLFRWFCKPHIYAELQGDLEEEFQINIEKWGLRKARRLYRKEVIKMIRPSVIKAFKTQSTYNNHSAMFKNYTLVALRNLSRNKLFSGINIIGLAISMVVGLVAIAFVTEMKSYDNFHEKGDRIYRIVNTRAPIDESPSEYATTSILTGTRLASDFDGFDAIAPISRNLWGDLKKGDMTITQNGFYANNDFFKVFTFPLIYGNPASALTEPNSIVLTEETATRLFGKTDVVGDVIEYYNGDQYKVTGIAKDPPFHSHIKFDAIASLETLFAKDNKSISNWGTMWSSYVYVLLPENNEPADYEAALTQLAEEENAKFSTFQIELGMESLDEIVPGNGKYNQMYTIMPAKTVRSIAILALIVVLSACFNYTNLSVARSIKRAKEVGVRKVVGARKSHLFSQFIIEAIFVATFALLIALLLFQVIRPGFLTLNPYMDRTTRLELTPLMYGYFFVFTLIIGMLAGFVPAIMMSKLKPVAILKGFAKIKSAGRFDLRKVLIGLQFTLSMGFAILVTLAAKQYKFALNYDLGFNTENVLNVDTQGNDTELLKAAFGKVPEVQGISTSSLLPSTGSTNSDYVKYLEAPNDSVTAYTMDIDTEYLNNMGHELMAGSNFIAGQTKGKIVINELLTEKLNLGTPTEALGKSIHFYNNDWVVTGVVKNFHHGTVNNKVEPFCFTSGNQKHYNLNLKMISEDITATMDKLEAAWKEVDTLHDFSASFYSESIERTYSDVSASIKTFGLLAGIAICISILGLLGMAVYTTESKVKELTIRKVLGATMSNLVFLLSKGFMPLFVISALVAIPAAYFMFEKTIVEYAVYKISVGFWELSGGALLVIAIAFLTIGSQATKAAKVNPAENLRNE